MSDNERDELAKLLFIAANSDSKEAAEDDWEFLQKHPKHLKSHYNIADALIAAGYRKVTES